MRTADAILGAALLVLPWIVFAQSSGGSASGGSGCGSGQFSCHGNCVGRGNICFLEPIATGLENYYPTGPMDAFFWYFNNLWPWILGVSAGIAILWFILGCLEIILSGGDQGSRSKGIERIKWAIFGILIIGFSSLILGMLNPSFYKTS